MCGESPEKIQDGVRTVIEVELLQWSVKFLWPWFHQLGGSDSRTAGVMRITLDMARTEMEA